MNSYYVCVNKESCTHVKTAIRMNLSKWYSLKYMGIARNNFRLRKLAKFPGFIMNHFPQGYLKHTYEEVWNCCGDDLRRMYLNKFRSYGDVCIWLLRYWQLASGNFIPYNIYKDGQYCNIEDETIEEISDLIIQQKKKLICLNDTPVKMDFENNKKILCNASSRISVHWLCLYIIVIRVVTWGTPASPNGKIDKCPI